MLSILSDKTRLTALAAACAGATRKQDVGALATLESEMHRIVYCLLCSLLLVGRHAKA
jgi:hypothetical protein